MSTIIRRSERLADTTLALEKKIHDEAIKKMIDISRNLKKSTCGTFEKIDVIMKILKLGNTHFSVLTHSSSDMKFLQIMYNNSFKWIQQVKDIGDEDLTEKMKKEYTKYRKKYEKYRYAKWEFIRDQYGMDANLMKTIDSYL
jgi:hypothetical protein